VLFTLMFTHDHVTAWHAAQSPLLDRCHGQLVRHHGSHWPTHKTFIGHALCFTTWRPAS